MALDGGKKFCLWMIILGALALITGSAAPFWLVQDALLARVTSGLWFYCGDSVLGSESCSTYPWTSFTFSDFTVWFYAVHVAAGLATLIAIVALFTSLGKVCGDNDAATGVGVWSLIAGTLGIAAAVVFYLKEDTSLFVLPVLGASREWAFIVFSAGTCVMALFSIVLLALPSNNNTVGPY